MERTWSVCLICSLLIHLVLLFLFPAVLLPEVETPYSSAIPVYIIEAETGPVAPELPVSSASELPGLEPSDTLNVSDQQDEREAVLEPLPTPLSPSPQEHDHLHPFEVSSTEHLVLQEPLDQRSIVPALAGASPPIESDPDSQPSHAISSEEPVHIVQTPSREPQLFPQDSLAVTADSLVGSALSSQLNLTGPSFPVRSDEASSRSTRGVFLYAEQGAEQGIQLSDQASNSVSMKLDTRDPEPELTDRPSAPSPDLEEPSVASLTAATQEPPSVPSPAWRAPRREPAAPHSLPSETTTSERIALVDVLPVDTTNDPFSFLAPTSSTREPAAPSDTPHLTPAVLQDGSQELPMEGRRLWNPNESADKTLTISREALLPAPSVPKSPALGSSADDPTPTFDLSAGTSQSVPTEDFAKSLGAEPLVITTNPDLNRDRAQRFASAPQADPLSIPSPTGASHVGAIAIAPIEPPLPTPPSRQELAVHGAPERTTASFTDWDHYVAPTYPQNLRALGVEGYVDIEIQTNPQGEIVTWRILEHEGHEAFRSAIEAVVPEWRFVLEPSWSLLDVSPPPFSIRFEFKLHD